MTFFQDFPTPELPPHPRSERLVPPPWAGPPLHELPAVFPIGKFMYRSPTFVLAVEAAKIYSTGCIIDASWMFRRTDQEDRRWNDLNAVFHRGAPHLHNGQISLDSVLLFGIQFPDGTKASTSSHVMRARTAIPQERPDAPVFDFRGKGGSSNDDEMTASVSLWLWPLPPAGDLRLVAQWTDMGMPESSITLDGTQLREAADRAQRYWPEDEQV